MLVKYRVIRRAQHGAEVIAEICAGEITGPSADLVRERLIYFGYPNIALEEALRRLRAATSGYLGYERFNADEG